jgi:hypothetical protein
MMTCFSGIVSGCSHEPEEVGVSQACREHGYHRSTDYR